MKCIHIHIHIHIHLHTHTSSDKWNTNTHTYTYNSLMQSFLPFLLPQNGEKNLGMYHYSCFTQCTTAHKSVWNWCRAVTLHTLPGLKWSKEKCRIQWTRTKHLSNICIAHKAADRDADEMHTHYRTNPSIPRSIKAGKNVKRRLWDDLLIIFELYTSGAD